MREIKDKLEIYEFDPDAVCSRCGCTNIQHRYQRYRTIINGYLDYDRETIKRTCNECGYMWDELPVEN